LIFDRQWTTKGRRWPFWTLMYSYCLEVILCQVVFLYKLLFSLIYIRYEALSWVSFSKKKQLPLKPSDQSFSMLLHIQSRTVCSHIRFLRMRTYVGEQHMCPCVKNE
jgi:hypothetical protein